MNLLDLKDLWRNVDCVCFDVDSTIIKNEAIDDLAVHCGVGQQVQALTLKAMNGNLSFRDALKTRLDIIKPTLKDIEEYNKIQGTLITPGAKELINILQERSIPIYLISGGFRIIIDPLADMLNINRENVYANRLLFTQSGEYNGFDETELTSASGGKAKVVELLKSKYEYKRLVMIGDGATDLETCPPADGFIGFGGNVIRDTVKKNSIWFVYSFQELIDEFLQNDH